ncbi:MAG: TraB/GumN family protein [Saprospiraceae bacterium]
MKKNLFAFSLLLLQARLLAQDTLPNALLWEISGHNLTEKSYLYGTIHLIPKEDFFLPTGFDQSFENAKTLYLELDLNEMNDMSKMMSIMDKCYMKDDKKLSDLISKEDYEMVSSKFQEMGLPMMIFEHMKPLFLSSLTAMEGSDPKELNSDQMKSYEMVFMDKANLRKMPLKGIETTEFQLSIFDSIPYEVQAKSLVESLKNTDISSDVSLKGLIELYKKQNLNKLSETVETGDQYLKPYMDIMVKNRNKTWIPIISEAMKNGSCFFAVGAGHLGGTYGLIKLLRENLYSVKPVHN